MWRDWQPSVISRDLDLLEQAGIQVMRVFPLWSDFQPLTALGTGFGVVELRHGETPLNDDAAGRAGMSSLMLDHFAEFADIAQQHGIKLIVGLLTGWMSGRLFVPPAFEGRNVITDPLALMWETRFVQYFVQRFRAHPAILAWDLGNECNCMGPATREQAWVWTSSIVNAIRVEDATRPVVSGMHSLSPAPNAAWRTQDQGELTDVLTTHPYPYFTPYCDQDPINTMRTLLHSTAESRMYADIGGKSCLVEEIGTLGPIVSSETVAADFARTVLFSAWAHDCHGMLWWCAFDFGHLPQAPYDWDAYERELGLFRHDGTPKPVLQEMAEFRRWLGRLSLDKLPPRQTDAVCILSEGQDQWAVAYSSFILAKQAGFDITFQYADQPIQDASFYMLPAISGGRIINRRRWLELLERVKAGATLYVSHDNGMLSPLTEPFGIDVITRSRRAQPTHITFNALPEQPAITSNSEFLLRLHARQAAVLGREDDGNPVFTHAQYGKGSIYFLSVPIEKQLTLRAGSFHDAGTQDCWRIYQHMAQPLLDARAVRKDNPWIGITEHTLGDRRRMLVLINYSPQSQTTRLLLSGTWQCDSTLYGTAPGTDSGQLVCDIAANNALVLTLATL